MPLNEKNRLQILDDFGILYSEPSPNFDRITYLAAQYFRVPISLVSFIGHDVQWIKSAFGVETFSSSREVAFCNDTIKSSDLFIVSDTIKDSRFSGNPFVVGDPKIRFYAGAPIVYQSGVHLGAVCVVDRTPRTLNREQKQALTYFAELVVTELRLLKAARLLREAYRDSRL